MNYLETADAVAVATQNTVFDEQVIANAYDLISGIPSMNMDELLEALFLYSGKVASIAASNVTYVFMTAEQVNTMMDEIMSRAVDNFLDNL